MKTKTVTDYVIEFDLRLLALEASLEARRTLMASFVRDIINDERKRCLAIGKRCYVGDEVIDWIESGRSVEDG